MDEDVFVTTAKAIGAGSQFAGVGLEIPNNLRDMYELELLTWEGGNESKTLKFSLFTAEGKTHEFYARTASTLTDVQASKPGILVGPGDHVGVTTTGATAAMSAKAYFRRRGLKR